MPFANPILKMFGRSPIRPLESHMAVVIACAEKLIPFIEAALQENWELAEQVQHEIVALEHEADELKKDIRLHLPKSLFLPVPRSDLLEVLVMQDKIANQVKDIAGIMFGRHLKIPKIIDEPFLAFVRRNVDAVIQGKKAIDELDELSETGFRGNEVHIIENMIVELDNIENDTDRMQIQIRKQLFLIEKDLPPVDVIFLYQLVESIGDIADIAHAVGGQLQLLIAS